jgi:hypothetical protein
MKLKNLQKKYPKFVYENYSYRISKNDLEIFFDFEIKPNLRFKPKVTIKNIKNVSRLNLDKLNNLIFHLGLVEILSYWKATCSPIIKIKAGPLTSTQINWWQDLIIKGMGQFFYENKIPFQKPSFATLNIWRLNLNIWRLNLNKSRTLVPVGGGKDSVVTLELLKKAKKNIQCFSLNPTEATQRIMKVAGCKKPIIVKRKIDKKLLELNRKGFLNGHTPFSAYLAFLSVLVAGIFNYKYIAFSNERSSNEGNLKYRGKIINHQWSKSFEFEKKFRNYSKKYLIPEVEYFSLLRPLYEIQIVKLFSKYPKYFPVFLSCNEAYKTVSGTKKPFKKWCGKCPKCLFVWVCLYPFLEEKKLMKIFGKNLFEDKKLLPIMQELIGERRFKPFECVGTKKETISAFYLSWKKANRVGYIPFLLKYFGRKILPKYPNLEKESKKILTSWTKLHNLPQEFKKNPLSKKD